MEITIILICASCFIAGYICGKKRLNNMEDNV
jgi:hypothetical protein